MDVCERDMPCPACSDRRAPYGDFYNPDSTIMRPDGLYVLSCRETGNGGALGLTSARHEHVKFKMIDIIKKYGSKNNIATNINKKLICEDIFPPKVSSGGDVPIRGDIFLDLGAVRKVFDIVISHPRAHSEPRVAGTPGIAAYIAALKKENLYYNNFVIPAGHMVPLSAETGGRLDGAFSKFLKEVVTSGLDFGESESPVPVWTKEKRALFTSRLRSAHVTISYAIARCTLRCKCPNVWVEESKTIARYPVCEAVGPLDT